MSSGGNSRIDIKCFPVGPLRTNCYLASDKNSGKAVVIDPGFPENRIQEQIKNDGIFPLYTINTHGHADHISGNSFFGLPVLIFESETDFLTDPRLNLSFLYRGKVEPPGDIKILTDGDIIEVGAVSFEVIHTPGHTPGGICLRFQDILFSGDTLFFEGIGRSDCPGGNQEELISSIKNKLMILPDNTKVYPGHGPETTIGHERLMNPFLVK
jgi:glyoxylase-like metal-dependent hydrolase (beta-lactamase superfamily II)